MFKKIITAVFMDKELTKDVNFLKNAVFFKDFTVWQIKKILTAVYKKDYSAGEKIYDKAEDAKLFCILQTGNVELSDGRNTKSVSVNGVFGTMPVIGVTRQYGQTARASSDSRVFIIYKDAFEEIMNNDAKIGFKVCKIILNNLKDEV